MAKSSKDPNEFLQEKLREFKDQCRELDIDPYEFLVRDLKICKGYEVYDRAWDGKFSKRVG